VRRRGHVAIVRKMIEERDDLVAADLARMGHGVEPNEAARPLDVRLLGPVAVVPVADGAADLAEQSRGIGSGGRDVVCQRVATFRQRGFMRVHTGTSLLRRAQFAWQNRRLALTLVNCAA